MSGVNWLGDSVMAMPAIQDYRRRNPDTVVTVAVKPYMAPLWIAHPAVRNVMLLPLGPAGPWRCGWRARSHGFRRAYVLPLSFRSALVPWVARIPERIGMPGHGRDWLLTRVVTPPDGPERRHQAFEYYELLGLTDVAHGEAPSLPVPDAEAGKAAEALSRLWPAARDGALVGILPGAARGPSKCWAPDRFADVGRRLAVERGCRILALGSMAEKDACERIAAAAGPRGAELAGRTSLLELAALLARCKAVIANDSGGMHLATAVGAKVVGIFGATDPAKTGPLGTGHKIVAAEGVGAARDIAADSAVARAALDGIGVERVLAAAFELLE